VKFEVVFEVNPSGAFGVPEEDKTVLPALPGEYAGDTIYGPAMIRVGYGTLSRYRLPEEAINEEINILDFPGRITDNFIFLNVEAETSSEAYKMATAALDTFMRHLSLNQRRVFSYKILYSVSSDGKLYPPPKSIKFSITLYNLEKLRQDIRAAQYFASLSDSRLNKALQYFEHAIFLYERRDRIAEIFSRHYYFLIAAVFLNLWKAVATIIGDPSKDPDYQRRYKKYGFDYKFFQQKIERLRKFRNDYDVAHYCISSDSIKEIEKNYNEALSTTVEVLTRYREYIAGNKQKSNYEK